VHARSVLRRFNPRLKAEGGPAGGKKLLRAFLSLGTRNSGTRNSTMLAMRSVTLESLLSTERKFSDVSENTSVV
jgi:hypothetical protein